MRRRGWGSRRGNAPAEGGGSGGGSGRLLERLRELRGVALRDVRALERIEGLPDDVALGAGRFEGNRPIALVASRRDGLDLLGFARLAARRAGGERPLHEVLIAAPFFSARTRRAAARAGERGPALHLLALPALAEGSLDTLELESHPAKPKPSLIGGSATLLARVLRVVEGAAAVTSAGALRPAGDEFLVYMRGERAGRIRSEGDGVAVAIALPSRRDVYVDELSFPRWGVELHEWIIDLAQDPRLIESDAAQLDAQVERCADDARAGVTARSVPWNADGSGAVDWVGIDIDGRPVVGVIRSSLGLRDVPAVVAGWHVIDLERETWAPGATGDPRIHVSAEQISAEARALLEDLAGPIGEEGPALELAREVAPRAGEERAGEERAGEEAGFEPRGRRRGRRRRRGRGGARFEERDGGVTRREGEPERETGFEARETDYEAEERGAEREPGDDREAETFAAEPRPEGEREFADWAEAEEPRAEPAEAREGDELRESDERGEFARGPGEPGARRRGRRGRRRRGRRGERGPEAETGGERRAEEPEAERDVAELEGEAEPAEPAEYEPAAAAAPEGDAERVADEIEATLVEGEEERERGAAAEPVEEAPPRARRSRAAILVRDDPESILAAFVLARDRRQIVSFRVATQDGLMNFFKGPATDIADNVDVLVVGFSAQPRPKEVLDTAELFRGRLQWFDHHEWAIEDLMRLRAVLGRDSILIAENAASPLSAVLQVTERRSRFTDKLVDLSARRLSEGDMQKWGYRVMALIRRLQQTAGEHRAEILPILSGKPTDLPSAPDVYKAETDWVEANDPRIVHFGEYQLAVCQVPPHLDPGEVGRRVRLRTGARLSLAAREGEDLVMLACNDEKRPLNVSGLLDAVGGSVPWVTPKSGGDRVGRARVADLPQEPQRMEALIGEIVRHRSILYG